MLVINNKPRKRRLYIVAVILLFITVAVFYILTRQEKTPEPASAPSASSETKGESPNSSANTSDTSTSTKPDNPADSTSNDDAKASGTTASLATPSGEFISSHRNVPKGAPLSSVCNTTSGANCQIIFTKDDGTQKTLPNRATDRSGSAYWDGFTAQSIGLSTGKWKVKAVATLNGQTKSADDPLELEIAP